MEDLWNPVSQRFGSLRIPTNFGHTNIIKYVHRPFSSSQEMDEALISNWNSVVKPGDTVFHLGDFALPDKKLYPSEIDQLDYTKKVIESLNGNITIIFGSHDKHAYFHKKLFFGYFSKNTIAEYKVDGVDLILSHCGMLAWERRTHHSIHFFGHVHSGPLHPFPCQNNSCDVGIDAWNFFPVSLEAALERARSSEGKLNLFDKYDCLIEKSDD
jgi:calcineurin-like phosphoesterase family protein